MSSYTTIKYSLQTVGFLSQIAEFEKRDLAPNDMVFVLQVRADAFDFKMPQSLITEYENDGRHLADLYLQKFAAQQRMSFSRGIYK